MSTPVKVFPRFSPIGDSVILLELGDAINVTLNAQVQALDAQLQDAPLPGVVEWVPAYASLLVYYDSMTLKLVEVQDWLAKSLKSSNSDLIYSSKQVTIPVRYGGDDGPDLDFVAEFHQMTCEEVVEKHTEQVYQVGMMGFTPGFAYLLGLNPCLSTPRCGTPRTVVPAGSVGIAGLQTGIYPIDSPGGWQLIGRTNLPLFNPDQEPPFLLSPGDEVRFIADKTGAVS